MTGCSVADCTRARGEAKGMCDSHYRKTLKYGDPHGTAPRKSTAQRFFEKVEKTDTCWVWTAALRAGYGYFRWHPKQELMRAHRYSYILTHGAISEDKVLDHICHNKACVNPEHLREVTIKQNAENRPGPQRNSKTGAPGVHWVKRDSKYRGGVRHHGKMHWVGNFDDIAEAEAAVIAKRNELFTHNDADRLVSK